MGIIDNPFNLNDDNFLFNVSEESKRQRKQDNAFSIAKSVGIKVNDIDKEAEKWIIDTYNSGLSEGHYEWIPEIADAAVPRLVRGGA